jgi:hypothetical protein
MLSGLSRGGGIVLPLDATEDWRERFGCSMEALVDPREREDDVEEEIVLVLEPLPKNELLFICSV